MKKHLLSLVLLLAIVHLYAQKITADKVPAAVKSKFASLYPKIASVKWELEKGNYEAGFDLNKVETSVIFDASGNLIETESEIPVSQLPKGVAQYIDSHYPGVKISEASKIVDTHNIVKYEAEIKGKDGKHIDVLFDAGGNFIK